MADVPVTNPTTGEVRMVAAEDVKAFTEQTGWGVSTAEQRHAAKLALGGGLSAGEVVQGAGEKAVRTATFGLLGPQGQAERDRQAALAEEHPYVAMGAQAAGALAPALVAGALTGGAGAAAGLSAGEAGLFAGAAEGLAGGAADEVEQARQETRDVSAGNIFLYGLGGEIVGRALPHALSMGAGKVRRALTAVEEAAGEGVPSALAGAEARSVESQARIARDLPPGSPERAAALRDSAAHHYERMATESADDLGKLTETTARMGETNAKRVTERLRETMADPSPAQTEWFTGAKERLDAAKREMRSPVAGDAPAGPAAPVAPDGALDPRFRGVNDEAAAYDRVLAEQKTKAATLTPDEAEAVKRYTYDTFKETNALDQEQYPAGFAKLTERESDQLMAGTLPAGTHGISQAEMDAVRLKPHLDEAMQKLTVKRPGILFHGGDDATGEFLAKLEPGKTFRTDRTLSTSLKADTGFGFSRQLEKNPFVLRFMNAAEAVPVLDDLSSTPGAHELLLGRNREFKVLRKQQLPSDIPGHEGRWLIDLEEIKPAWLQSPEAEAAYQMPSWYKASPDAPSAGAAKPARAPRTKTLANAPGMAPIAKEFDSVIDKGLKRLDKTTDTAEQYLAAREVKQQLQRLSDKVGRLADKYPAAEQMKATVDGAWQHVADGLTDKSLFGAAADIEREISSPFRDKIAQSLGTVEQDLARGVGDTAREFDPKKVRAFLKGDKVDRAVTQNHLERVLEGAEEQLAAHERHGTWDAGEIAATRERIGRIRESIGLADEIHVAKQEAIPSAKSGSAAAEPAAAPSRGDGMAGELAEFALEKIVGGAIPFAGQFIKLGKRILGMDGAARAATKQVARNLAGVGAGYAERALGGAARGAAGGAAAVGTMTALQRFTGDYSGPEESWEAKKKLLDDEQVSPDVLYEVLGNTLGDLPKVNPELFQQIAARTAGKIRYLRENLPPGLQVSLLYPNGTPPSQSALREWATQWNTVMDPETVLHDIDNGTATPLQMKTLKESDPDLYEQLRGDCIEQVGTHFKDVPTSTKLQLDLLFDADGLAGPMFSSAAADMVGQAMEEAAKRAPGAGQPSAPGGQGQGSNSGSSAPSGLEAIKTSVTNRGTGA